MHRSLAPARLAPRLCALALTGLLTGATLFANPQAPDNTAANKADRGAAPSADKARNDTSDLQLMRHIRRDIMKDKSLSTYAHNVKVVADHGKVTLRGPVRSEEEKKAIEEHAAKYAGAGNVTNELTVKGT